MREQRKDPEKNRKMLAHAKVGKAIRQGRLTREPCEVCGASFAEAHHDDYDKPLQVRWLCPEHHRAHHAIEKVDGRSRVVGAISETREMEAV
jgi:hypothetical protein